MIMVRDSAINVTIALLLFLLVICFKRHIAAAALLLGILSAFDNTRIKQRRIEKLEDEYRGQRSINLAAAERNRAASLALQQKVHSASSGNKACTRVHYDHPSAEIVRENHELKIRLQQLRLGGKTSTCTRTHNERSTSEIICANHILNDSTRKLRVTVTSLRSDVERREKAIKSLQRSLEALRATRVEETRDKDAAIWELERSAEAAAAHHNDRNNELYRLKAAAHHSDRYKAVYRSRAATKKAEASVKESILRNRSRASKENIKGGASTSTGVTNSASRDVDQQKKKVRFAQEGVDQDSQTRRPTSPKCATVEDDDEEEL
jgi:hypothetical protein